MSENLGGGAPAPQTIVSPLSGGVPEPADDGGLNEALEIINKPEREAEEQRKQAEQGEKEAGEKYSAAFNALARKERAIQEEKRSLQKEKEELQQDLKRYRDILGDDIEESKKRPSKILKNLGLDDPHRAMLDEADLEEDEGEDGEDGEIKEKALTKEDIIKLAEKRAREIYEESKKQEQYQQMESQQIDAIKEELTDEIKEKYPLAVNKADADSIYQIKKAKFMADFKEHGEEYAIENMPTTEQVLETINNQFASELETMLQSEKIKSYLQTKLGMAPVKKEEDLVENLLNSEDEGKAQHSDQFSNYNEDISKTVNEEDDEFKKALEALNNV